MGTDNEDVSRRFRAATSPTEDALVQAMGSALLDGFSPSAVLSSLATYVAETYGW